jgi:hypothetical protein
MSPHRHGIRGQRLDLCVDGGGPSTISVHHMMHWQDTSWLSGSANYILDETRSGKPFHDS